MIIGPARRLLRAFARTLAGATAVLALTSIPAAAQQAQPPTMTGVVEFLVTNQSVRTGDFVKDEAAAAAASQTIGRALLVALSTLPTSASSAGFTYRFNPALGTLERTTESFGAAFVERALTSGSGQAAFGMTWDHASFDRLDDRPLNDDTLVTTANRFVDEASPFDVETLSLDVRSTVLTGFGTVGITDRLDVGAAVPFVWVALDGVRNDTYRGTRAEQARATASTSGFGDVALRAKYNLYSATGSGFAIGGEVRLPTGRSDDLLGAGKYATRLLAIGSVERRHVAVQGNFGFGWGGVSDEVAFAGAFVVAATPTVTVSAELAGHRLADVAPVADLTAVHPDIPDVETIRLGVGEPGITVMATALSAKWNPAGSWLVKGSVLIPTTSAGLTARVRTMIGIDYAFGQ